MEGENQVGRAASSGWSGHLVSSALLKSRAASHRSSVTWRDGTPRPLDLVNRTPTTVCDIPECCWMSKPIKTAILSAQLWHFEFACSLPHSTLRATYNQIVHFKNPAYRLENPQQHNLFLLSVVCAPQAEQNIEPYKKTYTVKSSISRCYQKCHYTKWKIVFS